MYVKKMTNVKHRIPYPYLTKTSMNTFCMWSYGMFVLLRNVKEIPIPGVGIGTIVSPYLQICVLGDLL